MSLVRLGAQALELGGATHLQLLLTTLSAQPIRQARPLEDNIRRSHGSIADEALAPPDTLSGNQRSQQSFVSFFGPSSSVGCSIPARISGAVLFYASRPLWERAAIWDQSDVTNHSVHPANVSATTAQCPGADTAGGCSHDFCQRDL